MNAELKATSVRDLKDAARAIQFVLKNKIKGKAAVAALCDLLEVTARTVREESVGYVPHTVRKAAAKRVKPESASCCLCLDEITGHGHNAAPVNDGRCCDDCNTYVVIPARIKTMYGDGPKRLASLRHIDPRLIDPAHQGSVTVHGYRQARKGGPTRDWSMKFGSVQEADDYLGDCPGITVEFVLTGDEVNQG